VVVWDPSRTVAATDFISASARYRNAVAQIGDPTVDRQACLHLTGAAQPGRGHSLTIDSGWHEVADKALAFVGRFVKS
jgi:hypothetical protein